MALTNSLPPVSEAELAELLSVSTPQLLPTYGLISKLCEGSGPPGKSNTAEAFTMKSGSTKAPPSISELTGVEVIDWHSSQAMVEIDKHIDERFYQTYGGLQNMQKADYDKLASAVRAMREPIMQALIAARSQASAGTAGLQEELLGIIVAQIGLVLAKQNSAFNSMIFAAACKLTDMPK